MSAGATGLPGGVPPAATGAAAGRASDTGKPAAPAAGLTTPMEMRSLHQVTWGELEQYLKENPNPNPLYDQDFAKHFFKLFQTAKKYVTLGFILAVLAIVLSATGQVDVFTPTDHSFTVGSGGVLGMMALSSGAIGILFAVVSRRRFKDAGIPQFIPVLKRTSFVLPRVGIWELFAVFDQMKDRILARKAEG